MSKEGLSESGREALPGLGSHGHVLHTPGGALGTHSDNQRGEIALQFGQTEDRYREAVQKDTKRDSDDLETSPGRGKYFSTLKGHWLSLASFFLYFLFGQFMTGQRAQFSSSSFSMPKGIISPHWQTQPSDVFASSCSSQKGQASIILSLLSQ